MYLVNGAVMPKMTLRAGEYKLIRLLHVDQNADARNFRFGDCEAWLVGRDGIWRRNGPLFLEQRLPRPNFKRELECKNPNAIIEQYKLPGATRADIVLSCPAGTTQTITIYCEPVMTIETEPDNGSYRPPSYTFGAFVNAGYGEILAASALENGFAAMYEERPFYIHEDKSRLYPGEAINVNLEVSAQDLTGPNYDGPYSRYSPNVIIDYEKTYLFDLENGQNGHVSKSTIGAESEKTK
jgi:hypothetical protein